MEEKKINREWVKTAAIIFLAVLLVLTFFSNTIMNRTLPEVASAEVTDGPITAKIRGTGTVSSVGQTEVKATATQSVATVKAREGAEVKAGDVLFVMGEAGEELEDALEMLENAKFSLMEAYNGYPVNDSNSDIIWNEYMEAENAVAEAEIKLKAAEENDSLIRAAEEELAAAELKLSTASKAQADIRAEAYNVLQGAQAEFDIAKKEYDEDPENPEKKARFEAAKIALETAQKAYDEAQADSPEEKLAKAAISNAQSKISELEKKNYVILKADYDNAVQKRDKLYSEYLTAESSDKNNGKAAQSANIAVARAQADINRWEKKVAELSGGEDYAIKAPIGGTISALSVSPGEKVSKDQVMCIIEVPDLGYQMSFSVTNDQVKRIKVGDPATVSSFFWGSTIEAEVSSIKVDPKDPQSKKLITCTLDGDVEPGSEISVSIGNKSANYDVIVPNSAVRTDSNGSFVLMITSKNSPLGNRYFAERVPVEVLASDDTNSALNANLGYGDFVITTSSSPIKNGDQVRMADNG